MPGGIPRFAAPGVWCHIALCFCVFGCAAKESTAPPMAATSPAELTDAPPANALSNAASGKTPSDSGGSVKVEPASPEELKAFIASQRGKVVLVDFWATYCLPCREKFPRTLALARKYSDQGLTAVSMSMDSPEPSNQKKILEFLARQKSEIKNFANRLEDTDAAFAGLDISGGALPHYKVFGRNGKLRNKFGGDPDHPFDDADIEQAIVSALKEH
jgi:thiol-disulfide isomerase/thioredoxin